MNTRNLLLAGTAVVTLCSSLPAFAGGTPAATGVVNTFDVDYSADGVTVSLPGIASDSFVVDETIKFTLTPENDPLGLSVDPAQADAALVFALTNTGNSARSFDLDLAVGDAGDPLSLSHDPSGAGDEGSYAIYLSDTPGGTGVLYDPAGLVATPEIDPDQTVYVRIVSQIPADAADGELSTFSITARPLDVTGNALQVASSSFGSATTEVVFGDSGADGSEIGEDFYEVHAAMVSATKTLSVASENRNGQFLCAIDADEGGSAMIPGACLNYTITLSNAADASEPAVNFGFSDALPANMTFMGWGPRSGFDGVSYGGDTVSGQVNSLAPGQTATMTFRVQID